MAGPLILVRADAGAAIGSGHVVRCLSVGTVLRDRGATVVFATRSPATLRDRIAGAGIDVVEVPPPREARSEPSGGE